MAWLIRGDQASDADLRAGAFPSVRALVWFDVNKEAPWDVHSDPDALAAWSGALRAAIPHLDTDL